MNGGKRPIKVLIAKPGLDGHDRGAKVLTLGLMDAGMEVIYTGIRQTPEAIVAACLHEDPDVVGLSSLAGGHMYFFPRVAELLKDKGLGGIVIIGGGIVPEGDIPLLKEKGVAAIFGPGTMIEEVVEFIKGQVNR
jgi:methylmalonyl-CoA mutase C-terminal domain/subunit